jgi:hypothetical protein
VQAIGGQPQRAPEGAPVHYERHRPEQSTLYWLMQQLGAACGADAPAGDHRRRAEQVHPIQTPAGPLAGTFALPSTGRVYLRLCIG